MPNQNQNNANRPGRTRPQHESEIVSEMGKLQPQDLPMEEAVRKKPS